MQKRGWLDYLFYKIGKQQYDFRLNSLEKKEDGSVISSKWRRFSEIVFPVDKGEEWKLRKINNREILPCEVVIDLEEEGSINKVVAKLFEDHILNFYIFKTGSRGFHIHIFSKRAMSNAEKLKIIRRYGGDEQKANNGTTIALEYAHHWKTGKIKTPWYIEENGN